MGSSLQLSIPLLHDCLMHSYSLKQVLDEIKHIGPIADSMAEWDGTVGDALELTYAEREEISDAHRGKLANQK